jgi:quinol monooxygenase YgiN
MKAANTLQLLFLIVIFMLTACRTASVAKSGSEMIVRISEIEIDKDSLPAYKAILKEEAAASVRLEPGVISIFPMYQQKDSTQIRILEIYASKEAYQSHIKSPHFQHYKTATLSMVKALQLIDMNALDAETMNKIFSKLKH